LIPIDAFSSYRLMIAAAITVYNNRSTFLARLKPTDRPQHMVPSLVASVKAWLFPQV
jgi:hypothetical protein